jgi:4'-phosphopantetheinyl transferase
MTTCGAHQKLPKITNRLIQRTHLFQDTKEPALETDEIHVWKFLLERINVADLQQLLSANEIARASRFRLAKDKAEYIGARAFLRVILSKYLNTSPEQLSFEYNKYGKPFIKDEAKKELKFNMSHSQGVVLCAVTLESEVGIDLELINPVLVDKEIAQHSLTEYELGCFKNLAPSERLELFYKCWTRKEAYAKAVGDGLLTSPNKIETLSNKTHLIYKPESYLDFTKPSIYSFYDLPEITGFASALVVQGTDQKKLRFKFANS